MRKFLVFGALALLGLAVTCEIIGANISAEPLSKRVERACASQYAGDDQAEQKCELDLLLKAVEHDDATKRQAASDAAGL